jgi:phosphoribosylglycinamide formyltransferase 1
MKLNLGFLASHNGSNVEAIINNIELGNLEAQPKVIISNNPDARILNLGRNKQIPSYCINKNNTLNPNELIFQTLKNYDLDLIILAGYMKKIGNNIIIDYSNKILNIHPSLLPKYGGEGMYGMRVHEKVIGSDDNESGATIHLVTEEYDQGRILAQYKVPRYELDTVSTLAERVLRIEHVLYSQTLIEIQKGIICL